MTSGKCTFAAMRSVLKFTFTLALTVTSEPVDTVTARSADEGG